MRWPSGEAIFGFIVAAAWLIGIGLSVVQAIIAVISGVGHEADPLGSAAEKAVSAIWSLNPWLSHEFRAACSAIGIVATTIFAKKGMLAAESERGAVGKKIVRLGIYGLICIAIVVIQSLVPLPEWFAPGNWAHLRFFLVGILSLAATILLSWCSGLEVGLLLSRGHGASR